MAAQIAKRDEQQVSTVTASDEMGQLVAMLERVALNPDITVEKMNGILDVQERMMNKRAETDFNAAMSETQAEIGRVAADATNPQTKSRYASYAALDRKLRPIYTKHGFALSFDEGDAPREDWVRVLCHVSHRGGHTRTYKADMPADGKGAKGGDVMTKTHAAGSAKSYGKRYLLKDIFNVAIGEDDDDGNAADVPTITGKQADDLAAMIDEVGADYKKFLTYFKIQQIASLPAKRFKEALAMLEAKRQQS